MEKTTQKEILLRYLESFNDWVVSHQLVKTNTPFGWLGTGTLQLCRDLEANKYIEKDTERDKYVWYRITDKGRIWLDERESPVMQEFRKMNRETEERKTKQHNPHGFVGTLGF
jgi:hypothetical protein